MEKKYARKTYFIDRHFQTGFILKFGLLVIVSSLLIGGGLFLFSRGSTTVAIENTQVVVKRTADFIMPAMIMVLIIVSVFSAAAVLFLTLFSSHKISGPLFRLKREVDKMARGDLAADFHIRGDDQLQNIARSLEEMASAVRNTQSETKEKWGRLYAYLKEDNLSLREERKSEASSLAEQINTSLDFFKV